jgi:hypothetical protein
MQARTCLRLLRSIQQLKTTGTTALQALLPVLSSDVKRKQVKASAVKRSQAQLSVSLSYARISTPIDAHRHPSTNDDNPTSKRN